MRKYLFIVVILIGFCGFSQTYNMQNGTYYTCSGTFYDSGGSGGYYSYWEAETITFCPDTPGSFIQLDFTQFDIEGGGYDFMMVYNGPDDTYPLMGTYETNPGTLVSSDPGGCLTIYFESDYLVNYSGWAADISCVVQCDQTIVANLDSTLPAANGAGVVEICQGDSVTFNGSGTFSGSSAGAVYTWDFGDGTTGVGQSVSHTYPDQGIYTANLTITTDICTSNNFIKQYIHVSPTPDFTGTVATDVTICQGDTTTITGVVAPQSEANVCAVPVTGTTFLPDSSSGVYSTCVTVDCYSAADTVQSISDIQNIFMNIEHSYLGDLTISITAPNGVVVDLHEYIGFGAGATNRLGTPDEADGTGPGVGWDYAFVQPGTIGVDLANAPTMANGNGDLAKQPGSWDSDNSFAAFIGSPLNGNWCLTINDDLGSDDGYIFSWGITIDPAILPFEPNDSFTQAFTSETWTANDSNGNIINTSGNTITVQPTSTGSVCYTFTVIDDFGCSYDEEVCINVTPTDANAGVDGSISVCDIGASIDLLDYLGGSPDTGGSWSGPSVLAGGDSGTFDPSTNTAGTYTYEVAGATCGADFSEVEVTIDTSVTPTFTQ
ncbi:PKD domain-containing protein, partial [Lacinutrix sp. C3R15]|uniref:PKD domain-containing protein n=1 Tax=Flavobacteriaceae TaxID=49546 RepID=UPI001C09C2C8